ncbi:MAG: hypothetical protein AAGF11_08565, partial [Myxococcota bacterium]
TWDMSTNDNFENAVVPAMADDPPIDLHLTTEGQSEFANIAQRTGEDLPFDFDLHRRPEVGEPDLPGADVPPS